MYCFGVVLNCITFCVYCYTSFLKSFEGFKPTNFTKSIRSRKVAGGTYQPRDRHSQQDVLVLVLSVQNVLFYKFLN